MCNSVFVSSLSLSLFLYLYLCLSLSNALSLSLSLSCNQRYILTRFQHNSVFFETLSCISSFLCSALRPPQLHIFCRYYFIVLQHLELSERRVSIFYVIFPRASERRVLLIVGSVICVCHTSSHLHVFTSSHTFSHLTSRSTHIFISSHIYSHLHTHIFISPYLHILISSHTHIFTLTSSHLHILTSSHSHLHIFTYSHLHSHTHILTLTSSHLHI